MIVTLMDFYKVNWKYIRFQQGACLSPFLSLCSNDFDVGLEPDISLADMYRWKISAYAPCSSTCTTGKHMHSTQVHRHDNTHIYSIFSGNAACESCSTLVVVP